MFTVRTIVHPTDLSPTSLEAYRIAHCLARDYGARLVVVMAYPPPVNDAEAVDRARPGGSVGQDLLARMEETLTGGPAVPVLYRVGQGDLADVILDEVARENGDLIVMATHGRGGVRRAVFGSVAEAVSRRAPCPVVTVRPGVTAGKDVTDDPSEEVAIPAGSHTLHGTMAWTESPRGVVVFAHGSGSSRHSPRNRAVAGALNEAGYATLLLDLLEEAEAEDRKNVFDADLLARRLVAAMDWVETRPEFAGLPIALFGASTGSGAALKAAALRPGQVVAVISRGGPARPGVGRVVARPGSHAVHRRRCGFRRARTQSGCLRPFNVSPKAGRGSRGDALVPGTGGVGRGCPPGRRLVGSPP